MVPSVAGSTPTSLSVGTAAAAQFQAGDPVAVDEDYVAQVGFVGSGVRPPPLFRRWWETTSTMSDASRLTWGGL